MVRAYSHDRYFDWGFLAFVEVEERARAVADLTVPWDSLLDVARRRVAQIMAPVNGPGYGYRPEHLTFFYNTTGAFQRVLSRIDRRFAESNPTLLTTDLEFPGCSVAIDDVWTGRVVVAEVAETLMAASGNADDLLASALIRAANFVKPRVIFLSHVLRTTGQVLSTETLQYFRAANPDVVIVLDGSQALGNVVVDRTLLGCIDFYVGCGHKWLGGMTSSGFVWRAEGDPNVWRLSDPAQSTSFPGYLGGTGNAAAWVSLNNALGDLVGETGAVAKRLSSVAAECKAAAGSFLERIRTVEPRISVVTPTAADTPPSGMIVIRMLASVGRAVESALQREGFAYSALRDDSVPWTDNDKRFAIRCDRVGPVVTSVGGKNTGAHPPSAQPELRFCFHRSHGRQDAARLGDVVADAALEAKPN
jgi:selenocysteine lyase/cysteine desulfurase